MIVLSIQNIFLIQFLLDINILQNHFKVFEDSKTLKPLEALWNHFEKYQLTLLYTGGGHSGPPLAKSAPVHQGLHFE